MKIEQLMTRSVQTVSPATPLKEVAELLGTHHISGLPVCGADGAILGVISEADILRKEEGFSPRPRRFAWLVRRLDGELGKIAAETAGDAMTSPALTVRPSDDVSTAARLMVDHRINRLPVVADGTLVGIVTRADLVRAFTRADEVLADEIRDDLLRTLWIDPRSLDIAVEAGVVSLTGSVDSEAEAELVVAHIRRVPGVVDVFTSLRSRGREHLRSVL